MDTALSPESQRDLELDLIARALYSASELDAKPSWSWDDRWEVERVERLLEGHGIYLGWCPAAA